MPSCNLAEVKNMVQWLPATWRKAKTWYEGFLQLGGSQKHGTKASCNLAEAKNTKRWYHVYEEHSIKQLFSDKSLLCHLYYIIIIFF
jgi:hypothetical protein